jgi:hypothetical protein
MSTLSSLLPGIIADGLPSEWLLIETIPPHELPDHSFDKLFQSSGYCELSEPGSPSSAELSQLPLGTVDTQRPSPLGEPSQTRSKLLLTVDTQRADTVVDPALDPKLFNQPSFHGQDAAELAQGTLEHRASEDLWLPSPTAGIDNRTPKHITSDFSEDGPSLPQSVMWGEQTEYNPPGIDNGTPMDFISSFGEDGPLSPQPSSVVWAGDTEHNPPGIAIEARNKMIHDQYYYSTTPDWDTFPQSYNAQNG